MSRPALQFHIRADKTGPEPEPGQPWPTRGIEINSDLSGEVLLPTSFVERHLAAGAPWLTVDEIGVVERPSRPEPVVDKKGSTTVAAGHRMPGDGMPAPHAFRHLKRIVFDTLNLGTVSLLVEKQPDKYVDSDDPTEKVTAEIYAEGRTRVDSFYVCTQES